MDPGQSICLLFGSLAMIGAVIARMWFAHEERKLKIRTQGQNAATDGSQPQIDALREELARLRDTSTQYDVSIQHTLEDMQQRLERLESRRQGVASPAAVEETSQQAVGLGNS